MTRSRYAMLCGIASAAFGVWWWRRRGNRRNQMTPEEKGETIFTNTPKPTGAEGIL